MSKRLCKRHIAEFESLDGNGTLMKIKVYSWILAGAYLICGAALFVVVPKCGAIFSGFDLPLPLLTRAALAVGAFGWLGIALIACALVVLKDLRFRSGLWSFLLTAFLVIWVGCVAVALLLPYTGATCGLQAHGLSPGKSPQRNEII